MSKQKIRILTDKLVVPKAISQTRKDIADWKRALAYTMMEPPKWHFLQMLYNEIKIDALFTSQYKNRTLKALSKKLTILMPDGDIDEETTAMINNAPWAQAINRHILDSRFFGYSVVEIIPGEQGPEVHLLPRTNVDPVNGLLYPDVYRDKAVAYRQLPYYGTRILEFLDKEDPHGLMNRLVPHILFKRFAQSAWSELAEIYGIPPRVLKTDTQNPKSLQRGKEMMENFGVAAWIIIDEHEEFKFASGINTNGDIYNNLIQLCNNEISMLVSGAIIGQDTRHGNRSKDETAQNMLLTLVRNDLRLVERYWNSLILPALARMDILPPDRKAQYTEDEDLNKLWEMTVQALPYYEVDPQWVRSKFGIEVLEKRSAQPSGNLRADDFFV